MGKYWSSRNTAAIGAPKVPPCTRSRNARNTGALRSTRPHWLATPAARGGLDERRGAGKVHIERFLAEHGAAGGKRLVDRLPMRRSRRADPDGIAAAGDPGRIGDDLDVVATESLREATGTAFVLVVHGHDRGVDDTAVDHGLEAQTVRPGDEPGPDEADAQHGEETRRWR